MPSKFYFRSIEANDPKPTGKASTDTDSTTGSPSDKNTVFYMLPQAGTAATSVAGSYNTATNPLYHLMRLFITPRIAAGTTLSGSQTVRLAIGQTESNAQMNLYFRYFIYVRTAAGTNAKTILSPTSDPTEEGTARTGCNHVHNTSSGDYTFTVGDRIVCEVWADTRNTRSTAYTATLYYNGATEPTEGVASTDEASFLEFVSQDIQLASPRTPACNFQFPGRL